MISCGFIFGRKSGQIFRPDFRGSLGCGLASSPRPKKQNVRHSFWNLNYSWVFHYFRPELIWFNWTTSSIPFFLTIYWIMGRSWKIDCRCYDASRRFQKWNNTDISINFQPSTSARFVINFLRCHKYDMMKITVFFTIITMIKTVVIQGR